MQCQTFIATYSEQYEAGDIVSLLENVPGVCVDDVLFDNSQFPLRYIVLKGDGRVIEQLESRDEFESIDKDKTGSIRSDRDE